MKLNYKVVENEDEFYKLKNQWEALNIASEKGCCFTSWYWMYEWWRLYKQIDYKLCIVCGYDDQRLVAIAPFYTRNLCNGVSIELRFIGTGEEESKEVASEYLDVIAHTEYGPEFAETLFAQLGQKRCWHRAEFSNLLQSSTIYQALRKLNSQVARVVLTSVGFRYRIELPTSYQDYLHTHPSANFRSKLKRSRKRFEQQLGGYVESVDIADGLKSAMQDLKRLHSDRWRQKGKAGAFDSAEFINFHHALAKHFLDNRNLLLLALKVGEETIAIFYGWKYKDTVSYYQSGINSDFRPNVSPGVLMHGYGIENAIMEGWRYYDFMKGGYESYKSNFACDTEEMFCGTIYNRNFKGVFFAALDYSYERWRGNVERMRTEKKQGEK